MENSEESVRLNRFLSDSGACSRREADKLIEEGHVTVDGEKATVGMKVSKGQEVLLKGKPVNREESLVFIALNKPRGIVCTTDRREKDNIIDFLKFDKRIYPIGRLDKESEGLILLTNDGSIVNKILRAGNYHEKEYIVTLDKPITAEFLKGMAEGVPILDTVTRPCTIKALDKFTFQIILTQGLNRQIRRMCEYFDYKVLTLKRIRIMNIQLGYLQLGGYRNVTEREIATLTEAIKDSSNEASVDENYVVKQTATKDANSSYNKNTRKGSQNLKSRRITDNRKSKKETSNRSTAADNKAVYGKKTGYDTKSYRDRKTDLTEKSDFKEKSDFRGKPEAKNRNDFKDKSDFRGKSEAMRRKDFQEKSGFKEKTDLRNKADSKDSSEFRGRSDNKNKTDFKSKPDFRDKSDYRGRSDTKSRIDDRAKPDFKSKSDFRSKRDFKDSRNFKDNSDFKAGTDVKGKTGFKGKTESKARTAFPAKTDYNKRTSDNRTKVYNHKENTAATGKMRGRTAK
nr:23S rRNA pseudouridine(2604) synthase RluF [Anaerocolumna chitinilytica]